MTRALRSPGSALKPLIYAMAFDEGLAAPDTRLDDSPRRFADYQPEDFDRVFHGPVTAREALMLFAQRAGRRPLLDKIGAAGQTTTDIGDNKNEKDDVVTGDTIFVHTNPRTNQQHGSAGGAQYVSRNTADGQKKRVQPRQWIRLLTAMWIPPETKNNEPINEMKLKYSAAVWRTLPVAFNPMQ